MFPARDRFTALSSFVLFASTLFLHAADPFAENIRPTEPLTPAQEQKAFHLPPGFEMQLVATEPDINKPMNMAFDCTGRLWVTTSREYPIPAPTNAPARDRIMIFEDFAPDGHARKVTEFYHGLNIPIGVYPFRSANSTGKLTWKCVVWAIPNIWLLEDTDGDGKADKREVLYGPFDYSRDTHGNQSSFRRGFDGWLYATHGFNNHSVVHGKDGHEVDMQSGNTYRFRIDGQRIEQHTHGQVNPFGLCLDPAGNLFSADCHSSPIYQLLRGAYYPSFGKPNDGLGFAPTTITHSHGSTAIAGINYLSDPAWPAEYRDNILIGNVMTSRIDRDRIEWIGSTTKGHLMPDFLSTDDPWFRPVDLEWGPDGALYVGDFYNRIIGHYEVPLTHPGRDRERGRIWRIVYRGKDGRQHLGTTKLPQDLNGLIKEMGSANPTRRMLAMNAIADEHGAEFAKRPVVQPWLDSDIAKQWAQDPAAAEHSAPAFEYVHSIWLRERLAVLQDSELEKALQAPLSLIRVHALRIIAERGTQAPQMMLQKSLRAAVLQALTDKSALAQREAADALGQYAKVDAVKPLLRLLAEVPKEDTHLRHVVRMSLRNQLEGAGSWALTQSKGLGKADLLALADVALAVKTEQAATFLLQQQDAMAGDEVLRTASLQHIARYAPPAALDKLAETVQSQRSNDRGFQLALFQTVQNGFNQRGATLTPKLKEWGKKLAQSLLATADQPAVWGNSPVEGARDTHNPWALEERKSTDGRTTNLISSHPHGEKLTGVLRSATFTLPDKLSFYLCGHDGFPKTPLQQNNHIRLRDAANGAVLFEVSPPRNDTARQITWDLGKHAGKQGYIEAVDANTERAYAWLAFGRFEPALPQLATIDSSTIASQQKAGAELAQSLGLKDQLPRLAALLKGTGLDAEVRAAAAAAVAGLNGDSFAAVLAGALADVTVPEAIKQTLTGAIVGEKAAVQAAVEDSMRRAPSRIQRKLALMLAGNPQGAELLLALAESGKVSPTVIAERGVKDRLAAVKPVNWEARLQKLTANLPTEDATKQKIIDERIAKLKQSHGDMKRGQELFTTVCTACHQLKGQGGLVGPQLDGIGNRGAERLIEDILDPNRNVDFAFRAQTIVMKDGDVTTGLPRREEGEVLVIANAGGVEVSIPKKDIKERQATANSLMPDNFSEAMTEAQFYDLLSFLIKQR